MPARQEGGNMRISYIYDMTAIFNKGKKKDEENKHWPSSYYEIQEILIDYLQPEQKPTHKS